MFDHNNDRIATTTGWIKSDDGLLARDINGNGKIDSGLELFGDQTKLSNGLTASNGFSALRDLDANNDGKFDPNDPAFGELRIWRDLNQDGNSQAEELTTLSDAGVAYIDLAAVNRNVWQNGNTIASESTLTKEDGSTATIAEVNLANNPADSRFVDTVTVSDAAMALPALQGSGKVRDLQEAATLSPALQEVLTRYSAATTRAEQLALLDELLLTWADTSGMSKSLEERDPAAYRVEYLSFGNIRRSDHLVKNTAGGITSGTVQNAADPLIDETYRGLIDTWNNRIHILESFYGSYFFAVPGQAQEGSGARTGMWVDYTGSTALNAANKNKPALAINYAQPQLDMLGQDYQALRQTVYDGLILQTRMRMYLEIIDTTTTYTDTYSDIDIYDDSYTYTNTYSGSDPDIKPETAIGYTFDVTRLTQAFVDKIDADPINGITDLIEFNRCTKGLLADTPWDGATLLENKIRSLPITPELQALYQEFNVRFNGIQGGNGDDIILGDDQSRTIYGGNGNDTLFGGGGNEMLVGGNDNDIISGGAGDDQLRGEAGDDQYIFGRGSGNDNIVDGQGRNSILFSGLNPGDITVTTPNSYNDDFVFSIKDTGETLHIAGGWNWYWYENTSINRFIFADGTVWNKENAINAATSYPTEGDDLIIGSRLTDSIDGLGGNDTIIGRSGDDVIDGGAGDDLLIGSAYAYNDYYTGAQRINATVVEANGNDIYYFGRGSGRDTIIDGDDTQNTDRLRFFEDVAPSDIAVSRNNDDLILTIKDTGDSVTIRNHFLENYPGAPEHHDYEVELIEFADGTKWTWNTLRDMLLTGTDGADTIIGYRQDDAISGGAGNDYIDARSGNDVISGGDGNDTISAGLGDDIIDGGTGDDTIYGTDSHYYDVAYDAPRNDNDTYLFGWGDGHDTIYNRNESLISSDTIRFKDGITASDVRFEGVLGYNEDLRIVLGDGTDSITVKNWFASAYYQIARMEFSDGTVLDAAYVASHLVKEGTAGNDVILGSRQSETISGYAGDDTLYGGDGNDRLDGGSGNDMLAGGYGNDTYLFGRGDGHDTAYEGFGNGYYWVNSPDDAIEFKADVLPEDVIVRRLGNDMLLTIKGSDDQLTVKDTFNDYNESNRIEQARFADGTIWDYTTLLTLALQGTSDDDILEGGAGNDVLDGGAGNDLLRGRDGGDTYRFGRGYGNDVIEESGWGGVDTVEFQAGIIPSDLTFTIDTNGALLITIKGSGDSLRLSNGTYNIERYVFSNGTTLTSADINRLAATLPSAESIVGTAGDDILVGSDINSTILGLEGNDVLSGADGDDWLEGAAGNDTLAGNMGDDNLYGGDGDDVLNGGSGRDYIEAGNGANVIRFEQGSGVDFVRTRLADGQADTIEFGAGITSADLQVQLGNQRYWDIQPGDSGYATLVVGTGDDAFRIEVDGWSTDISRSSVQRFRFNDGTELSLEQVIAMNDGGIAGWQSGFDGDDILVGSNADDDINGYDGNDAIRARAGNDYLNGGAGSDLMDGGSGNDYFYAGSGSDVLAGGRGDDTLIGSSGEDTYLFNLGDGNDIVEDNWDGGRKTISFGVGIVPDAVSAMMDEYGNLRLLVDGGVGGSLTLLRWFQQDRLTMQEPLTVERVQFVAADGSVRIYDLAGLVRGVAPLLSSSTFTSPVALFADAASNDITLAALPADGDAAVAYAQSGNLFGTASYGASSVPTDGDDRLMGTEWGDSLEGGAGNDLVYGLDGDDYLDGGSGHDRIDAGAGNDAIYGGSGNDLIMAGEGDDFVHAGTGNDIAYGGLGNDTFVFNAGDGLLTIEQDYMEYAGGGEYGGDLPMFASFASYGGDYGGGYGGGTESNVLSFGVGITLSDLRFSERDGYLIIDIPSTGDQVRLAGYNPDSPTLTDVVDSYVFADGSVATPQDILDAGLSSVGAEGDDYFTGTAGNNIVETGGGNDYLVGGFGNDRLMGGSGDDTYEFNLGDGVDTIVDFSSPGMENSVYFGYGISPDSIWTEVENGALVLRVGDGGDAIRFEGFDPNIPDMPQPVGRFDFWDGSSMSFSDLLSRGFEIVGTPEQDTLIGTSGDDRIRGLASDDLLKGNAGDDTYLFQAGDGVDSIDDVSRPGEWNTVVLPDGMAPWEVYLTHDPEKGELVLKRWGSDDEIRMTGFDRLDPFGNRAVEYFQFGQNGQIFSYDELLNLNGFEIRGTDGNDTLLGTATYDYIRGGDGDDLIISGTGGDYLRGTGGNDTYVFNRGDGEVEISDFLEEGIGNVLRFGPGITPEDLRRHLRFEDGYFIIAFDNGDTIYLDGFDPNDVDNSPRSVDTFAFDDGTTLSFAELARYTFVVEGDNLDNLLTGTNLDDRLYGYDGSDNLDSGTGEDVLTGGTGTDVLLGGGGRDAYIFNLGDGVDTITDTAENGIGNILSFGQGITINDLSLSLTGTTLTIGYGAYGDAVIIENFDPTGLNGTTVIDTFEFSDGSAISYRELVNHAPVAAEPLPDQIATQDQPFVFQLPETTFSDADGDQLTYRLSVSGYETPSDWLSFDPATRTISGTPGNSDVGALTVTVSAIDPVGATTGQSFILNVENVNDAPVVTAPFTDQLAVEDQTFELMLPPGLFADIDAGDSLTLSATLADGSALPSWLNFDAATGTFTGTPDNSNIGKLQLSVTATDQSGANVTAAFALEVVNTNDAPMVVDAIPAQTALEDSNFSFTLPATAFNDIDAGDALTLSAALSDGSTLPAWLQFDAATGTFAGTPGNDQVGNLNITVTATDRAGTTAGSSFALTVLNTNDTPVTVTPLTAQNVVEDQTFSYQIPADTFKDIDSCDSLTLSATLADGSALPSWLSFDAPTGMLTGTPGNDQVGTVNLSVTATDLSGATISTGLSLTVDNVNDAPVVTGAITDQIAQGGQPFSLAIPTNLFSDVDKGNILTITANSSDGTNLPAWLTYDQVSGILSGTPDSSAIGSYGVKLTATDQSGSQVDTSFNISVTSVPAGNSAPVVTPDTAELIEDHCPPYVTGNVLANDSDPDAEDSLTVADPGFVRGEYGYLGLSSDGKYGYMVNNRSYDVQSLGRTAQQVEHFSYTVTDGEAEVASSLDITIKGTNDAPVVAEHLSDQRVKNNRAFSFAIDSDSFVDIDKGDALTYTATLADGKALPDWLKFNDKTGIFSGTAPKNAGYLDIKVTATDRVEATGSTEGSLSVSDTFEISFGKSRKGSSCRDEDDHKDKLDWMKKAGSDRHENERDSYRSDHDDDRDIRRKDDHSASTSKEYLDSNQLDDYLQEVDQPSPGTDREIAARWQAVSDALKQELADFDNDFGNHRKQSGDFSSMNYDHSFGFGRGIADNGLLTAGSGTDLKDFKGLKEGMRRLG
ncbi:putative Ig domain-containing protein [Geotalea uraniireducens]|nr:putative Ig domain-containing protein [Geotalea uraniireducens]